MFLDLFFFFLLGRKALCHARDAREGGGDGSERWKRILFSCACLSFSCFLGAVLCVCRIACTSCDVRINVLKIHGSSGFVVYRSVLCSRRNIFRNVIIPNELSTVYYSVYGALVHDVRLGLQKGTVHTSDRWRSSVPA